MYLGALVQMDDKLHIRYSRSLYGYPLRRNTVLYIRTSSGGWEKGILQYNRETDTWYLDGLNCNRLDGLIVQMEEIE
mgnify:CR=1 FL=1